MGQPATQLMSAMLPSETTLCIRPSPAAMMNNPLSVWQATPVLSGDHTAFRAHPTGTLNVSPLERSRKTREASSTCGVLHTSRELSGDHTNLR